MPRRLTALIALIALPHVSYAASDIDNLGALFQPQFRLLTEDLGAALSYKAVAPAEPLGTTGFDIGVEVTGTRLQNITVYRAATTSGDVPSTLPVAKIHVHKGLPFGFDIGALYSAVPDSNIELLGAELRYAIVKGGVATPAVALRGSYTTLRGVDQLELKTTGADLSISKGFALFTPYAGIGKVWVTATPDATTGLLEEDISMSKYYVGANLNFGLLNFAVEGDKTGDATSVSAKLGWRF